MVLAGTQCTGYSVINDKYCTECLYYRNYANLSAYQNRCKHIFTTGPLRGRRCINEISANGFCDKCLLFVSNFHNYVYVSSIINKENDEDSEDKDSEG